MFMMVKHRMNLLHLFCPIIHKIVHNLYFLPWAISPPIVPESSWTPEFFLLHSMKITHHGDVSVRQHFVGVYIWNVWGPSWLGWSSPISWLRRQDISTHDISYVEKVSPCLTREMISTTRVMPVWRNDRNGKYMFMFGLKKIIRK